MNKNTFIALVLLIGISIIVYIARNETTELPEAGPDTIVSEDLTEEDGSDCGLTIESPVSGASVAFPLTVNAVVDNTNAVELGCSWTMFEAVAGSLTLKDENGATLATSFLSTTDEWMTTGPVNFSGTLSPSAPIASGTLLTLIIDEEDPSDGEAGPVSQVSVQLVAQ